jgi:hypothetical protein
MRMFGMILALAFCLTCKGASNSESERIATDLSLQSSVKIAIKLPQTLEDKKFRVQIGGLTAEKPPEVLFAVSLRCKTRKIVYHLGYFNFFNATGRLGREPTFTLDLPDLKRASCPLSDFYLAIQAEGVVAPDSFPHIKYVNLLADSNVTSAPRE